MHDILLIQGARPATTEKGSDLVRKLLNEDQRANKDICRLHVVLEGLIVLIVAQFFQEIANNLHADLLKPDPSGIRPLPSACNLHR